MPARLIHLTHFFVRFLSCLTALASRPWRSPSPRLPSPPAPRPRTLAKSPEKPAKSRDRRPGVPLRGRRGGGREYPQDSRETRLQRLVQQLRQFGSVGLDRAVEHHAGVAEGCGGYVGQPGAFHADLAQLGRQPHLGDQPLHHRHRGLRSFGRLGDFGRDYTLDLTSSEKPARLSYQSKSGVQQWPDRAARTARRLVSLN